MEYWGGLERTGGAPEGPAKDLSIEEAAVLVADGEAKALAEALARQRGLAKAFDRFGETLLMSAIRLESWDCAKALAAVSDWSQETPRGAHVLAVLAARLGHREFDDGAILIKEALRVGADPDVCGFDGVSAREAAERVGAAWAEPLWGAGKNVKPLEPPPDAASQGSQEATLLEELPASFKNLERLALDFRARLKEASALASKLPQTGSKSEKRFKR
jgi:hypothetical protein